MLLCVCQLNNISNTLTERESERERMQKKTIQWKKVAHSKETRFVICSFQTSKQLYRVLNFPQLRESKPQKNEHEERFWNAKFILFSFFCESTWTRAREVGEEQAKRAKEFALTKRQPLRMNLCIPLHIESHWISQVGWNLSAKKLEKKFITLTSTRLCRIMEL